MIYDTFIASNSSKGFFSYFEELLYDASLERIYLIKGGPGCGKSTFMKKIAAHFDSNGYTVEQIHCSSDPDSLDGINIHENKTVIIDATSPHCYDTRFPGALDSLVDLSRFWSKDQLTERKKEIIELTSRISGMYKPIYNILNSAGILYKQQCLNAEQAADKNKITSFVKKTVKQNAFTPIGEAGKVYSRFLTAISCKGLNPLECTCDKLCTNAILIEDEYAVSGIILNRFITYFKHSGYDVYTYHNPLCPETKIDHIIVPGLRFGIFSNSQLFNFPVSEKIISKKVNSRVFINSDIYSNVKNKGAFRKKLISEILNKTFEDLAEIKKEHDKLEQYYISAINYDSLNGFTDNFINDL